MTNPWSPGLASDFDSSTASRVSGDARESDSVTRLGGGRVAEHRQRISEGMKRGAALWAPFCSEEDLRSDYNVANMSQREIAIKWGVSQHRVRTSMRRYGIQSRRAIPRDQRGEKNLWWKGDDATYKGFHKRMTRLYGQPQECVWCGKLGPGTYDWANMTGRYENPSDYRRLCRSCHCTYDAKRRRAHEARSYD